MNTANDLAAELAAELAASSVADYSAAVAASDGSPLGPCRSTRRGVACGRSAAGAQVVAAMLSQVKGEQHRLTATALAPQRMEVRRPVIAGDHDLAVDQERLRLR